MADESSSQHRSGYEIDLYLAAYEWCICLKNLSDAPVYYFEKQTESIRDGKDLLADEIFVE